MSVLVIGFANRDNRQLCNWKRSMEHYGYDYIILGDGMRWENFVDTKIATVREYLKTIDPDTIVAILDTYDVLAVRHCKDLVATFHRFRSDIVLGAENYCGSNCEPNHHPDTLDTEFKYVNGGGYIGYASAILNMYAEYDRYKTKDDQLCLSRYVQSHPERVRIDTESLLIANIHPFSRRHYSVDKDGIYRNDLVRSNVFFAHFPGPTGKLGMDIDNYGCILVDGYLSTTYWDWIAYLNRTMELYWDRFVIGTMVVVLLILLIIGRDDIHCLFQI